MCLTSHENEPRHEKTAVQRFLCVVAIKFVHFRCVNSISCFFCQTPGKTRFAIETWTWTWRREWENCLRNVSPAFCDSFQSNFADDVCTGECVCVQWKWLQSWQAEQKFRKLTFPMTEWLKLCSSNMLPHLYAMREHFQSFSSFCRRSLFDWMTYFRWLVGFYKKKTIRVYQKWVFKLTLQKNTSKWWFRAGYLTKSSDRSKNHAKNISSRNTWISSVCIPSSRSPLSAQNVIWIVVG